MSHSTYDPFKLPPSNPFSKGEGSVGVAWWFWETYRVIPHLINDNREYTDKLIDHLLKQGGEVIEQTRIVENEEEEIASSGLSTLRTLFRGQRSSQISIWYKECWIQISGDEGERTFYIWHKPGAALDLKEFEPFLRPLKKASVSVLLQGEYNGLYTEDVDFDPPAIEDLELNYGTGFNKAHDQIVEKLKNRRAGLVLLHGVAGSGKSFYIKYLTSLIDREFIFIPVGMVSSLTSPAFVKFLMSHQGAVLILEDAEQALASREEDIYNSSITSSLLNLSDGILGQIIGATIIASFNFDKSNVDKALLRRGRLLYDHEFKKLSVEDARRLATRLSSGIRVEKPTSLADIYNAAEETGYKEVAKPKVGFVFKTDTTPNPAPV